MPYTDSHGRPELVAGDWLKQGIAQPRAAAPAPHGAAEPKHHNGDRGRPPQTASQDETAEQ